MPQPPTGVDEQIRLMRFGERSDRIHALESVTLPGQGESALALTECLVECLGEPDLTIRKVATDAFFRLGEASLESLMNALHHENGSIRLYAIRILGDLGDRRAVPPLIDYLQGGHWDCQYEVLEALIKLQDDRAMEAFVLSLASDQPDVREIASQGLVEIGLEAAPVLVDALTHSQWQVRKMSAEILGRLGDRRACAPLIEALDDEDTAVCIAAIAALGAIRDCSSTDALLPCLHHPVQEIRLAAVDVLGHMDDDRAVPALIDRFRHEVWTQRERIVESLARLGQRGLEPMVSGLEHPNPRVRIGIAETLGFLRDEGAVDPLIRALGDQDPVVRSTAARSLAAQPARPRSGAPAALVEALGDSNHTVVSEATEALTAIGADGLPALVAALTHARRIVRCRSAGLIRHCLIRQCMNTAPDAAGLRIDAGTTPFLLDTLPHHPEHHADILEVLRHVQGDALPHWIAHLYNNLGGDILPILERLKLSEEWRPISLLIQEYGTLVASRSRREASAVKKTLRDTARKHKALSAQGFCSQHYARFSRHTPAEGIPYFGCRMCRSTLFGVRASRVDVVLDRALKSKGAFTREGRLQINWLAVRSPVDLDRVLIGACTADDVASLCMALGNETDPERIERHRAADCLVLPKATLRGDALNLLKQRFRTVRDVGDEPD